MRKINWRESTHANIKNKEYEKKEEKGDIYIVYNQLTGEEYLRCGHPHIAKSTVHRLKLTGVNADYKKD